MLGWSLLSAAGVSLTFIMFRAALADQRKIAAARGDEQVALFGRRGVRGVGSRLVALATYALASGTLWTTPEPARHLADVSVRLGFAIIFTLSAAVLLAVAIRDLLDTLHLLEEQPPVAVPRPISRPPSEMAGP